MSDLTEIRERRMLVIGNGFDLAHGLPTRYQDMLNEIKNLSMISRESIDKESSDLWLPLSLVDRFSSNPFIKYFEDDLTLNGWTDFETKISNIIHCFQNSDYRYVPSVFSSLKPNPEMYFIKAKTYWKQKEWSNLWSTLQENLDELIEYIDYYLIHVISHHLDLSFRQVRFPQFIYEKKYNYLLSFNYTDTYCQIASKLGITSLPETHFIHGRISSYETPANIVLGIEDSDPDNLDTVYFKKYFQRIQKKTGREVFDWIDPQSNSIPIVVDIFGHSLDTTDRDILLKIMNFASYTTIYYLNQGDYEQKILNLIRIFGSPEAFTQKYYSNQIRLKCIDTEPQ